MSWLAADKPRDRRRKPTRPGRKAEAGGHKRVNISLNKFTREALQKIKQGKGNISQFIEKQLKPVIENLDPGEASVEIWRFETHLNQKISEALIQDKPEKAQALLSVLVALKDFRSLSGIPPLDPKLFSTEEKPSKDLENLEFYIKYGLLTKEEIDVYTTAKTLLKILPKNSTEYVLTKLIIIHFNDKIESLKKFKEILE